MISIAICDDNLSAVSEIERVLEQIPHQTILFDAFYSGEELLKYVLSSHEYYDIYLLDIEMKSVNGLEVAKQINLFSPNSLIVFITSYEKYIYEAFDALAFNFIKKPIDNQRFQAIIEIRGRFALCAYFIKPIICKNACLSMLALSCTIS